VSAEYSIPAEKGEARTLVASENLHFAFTLILNPHPTTTMRIALRETVPAYRHQPALLLKHA
jgi:hypothetical protein